MIVPSDVDRQRVHEIIYNELCNGIVRESSKQEYQKIIALLVAAGAEGIIAGCTEIGLLIKPEDITVPLFDTANIHAQAATTLALADDTYLG